MLLVLVEDICANLRESSLKNQTSGGESRSAGKDPVLRGGGEVAPAEQTAAKRGEEVLEERRTVERRRSVCLRPAPLCWHSAHSSCRRCGYTARRAALASASAPSCGGGPLLLGAN